MVARSKREEIPFILEQNDRLTSSFTRQFNRFSRIRQRLCFGNIKLRRRLKKPKTELEFKHRSDGFINDGQIDAAVINKFPKMLESEIIWQLKLQTCFECHSSSIGIGSADFLVTPNQINALIVSNKQPLKTETLA